MTVSIILPAYNAENFVGEAVQSVLDQTWTDWELIIINDGSTDNTGAIADGYDDPRIKVIHQENAGVSAARNAGLDAVTGEYVTFLDADDLLPRSAIEIRRNHLIKNMHVDFVYGVINITKDDQLLRQHRPVVKTAYFWPDIIKLNGQVVFGVPFFIRANKVRSHRFLQGLTHCEDLIFQLQVTHDERLMYSAVSEVVYEWRRWDGTASANLQGFEDGYSKFLSIARGLPNSTILEIAYLRLKIAKIMFMSWLAAKEPVKAVRSLFRILFQC